MITVRAGSGAIGICLLLLTAGCSREQQDWRSAEAADTMESYGQFIQRHPESELATQARTRVAQLGEERDWQHAGSADNADAYRQFLVDHPTGKWSEEARIRIENFALGQPSGGGGSAGHGPAGGGLAAPGEAAVPAGAGSRASAAPPATAALAKAGGGSGYGIQLGAFSSEAAADGQWHALTARYGTELGGLQEHVVAADTPSGRVYRLQASVGDEGRARALCETLRQHSQACVAVLPH